MSLERLEKFAELPLEDRGIEGGQVQGHGGQGGIRERTLREYVGESPMSLGNTGLALLKLEEIIERGVA